MYKIKKKGVNNFHRVSNLGSGLPLSGQTNCATIFMIIIILFVLLPNLIKLI